MAGCEGRLGAAELAQRELVAERGRVAVEEAKIVFGELGWRRAEAAGCVGLGAQYRMHPRRVGPARQVGAQLGAF